MAANQVPAKPDMQPPTQPHAPPEAAQVGLGPEPRYHVRVLVRAKSLGACLLQVLLAATVTHRFHLQAKAQEDQGISSQTHVVS